MWTKEEIWIKERWKECDKGDEKKNVDKRDVRMEKMRVNEKDECELKK